MTTPSIRQKAEDGLAYNLAQINPGNGYENTVTTAMLLRRPLADMTGKNAILMYPGPEDVPTAPDEYGSNLWNKKLTMALKWYYQDKTKDGSGRFSRLADIERMVGLRKSLPGADLINTVELVTLGGNTWGGMEDGQSDTWIAVILFISYKQRVNDPGASG